jgi:hypothetical protein
MSIEAVESTGLNLEEWLKSEEVGELQKHLEERIMRLLFSKNLDDIEFRLMAEQLAWIGAKAADRPRLEREIIQLNLSLDSGQIVPCGLKKLWKGTVAVANFVWDHKVEILVGAAICATGFGIAGATGYTTSVAVGGVVVAGAGSIFEEQSKPNPRIPRLAPPPVSQEGIAAAQQLLQSFVPKLELPSSPNELLVTADGIWANGQFYSNSELMQNSPLVQSIAKYAPAYDNPFAPSPNLIAAPSTPPPTPTTLADAFGPAAQTPQHPQPTHRRDTPPVISTRYTLPGKSDARSHIGWINGINNTFDESRTSGAYIQHLADGYSVAGIYNCSHTVVTDLFESTLLNYSGHSLITAGLLQNEWKSFHEANTNRPNAKLLQICHSQGALHVRNALRETSPEIRDRVIVLAIAPAAVVPRRLCFKSFNYASEKDIIHKFEPSEHPVESLTFDDVLLPTFGEPIDDKAELVILTPHAEATGIDHNFQSPTFLETLSEIIADYKHHGGEYLPEEKGK